MPVTDIATGVVRRAIIRLRHGVAGGVLCCGQVALHRIERAGQQLPAIGRL